MSFVLSLFTFVSHRITKQNVILLDHTTYVEVLTSMFCEWNSTQRRTFVRGWASLTGEFRLFLCIVLYCVVCSNVLLSARILWTLLRPLVKYGVVPIIIVAVSIFFVWLFIISGLTRLNKIFESMDVNCVLEIRSNTPWWPTFIVQYVKMLRNQHAIARNVVVF